MFWSKSEKIKHGFRAGSESSRHKNLCQPTWNPWHRTHPLVYTVQLPENPPLSTWTEQESAWWKYWVQQRKVAHWSVIYIVYVASFGLRWPASIMIIFSATGAEHIVLITFDAVRCLSALTRRHKQKWIVDSVLRDHSSQDDDIRLLSHSREYGHAHILLLSPRSI